MVSLPELVPVAGAIWTRKTLFFDSLDTQKFMSEFAEDDFS